MKWTMAVGKRQLWFGFGLKSHDLMSSRGNGVGSCAGNQGLVL